MVKELPIGVIDFRDLIKGNFIYVDKTMYVYDIVKRPKGYYFLSRPRRFGKSLTVSVLEYLFRGEKELFEDTWIYNKWNWESFPVVRLDVNNVDSTSTYELEKSLSNRFKEIAKLYDIEITQDILSEQFYELIVSLYTKYNKPVVLLLSLIHI